MHNYSVFAVLSFLTVFELLEICGPDKKNGSGEV